MTVNRLNRTEWAAVLVAASGLIFFFGDEIVRKVDSWKAVFRDKVEDAVPIDYEIERAQRRTAELIAAIIEQREVVVRQAIDVEALEKEVVADSRQLQKQKQRVLDIRGNLQLTNEGNSPTHDTPQFTSFELQKEFDNFRLQEATVDARRKVLEIRRDALTAARNELKSMENRRHELLLMVENLVARLELLRLQTDSQSSNADESGMAECEAQLERLDARLRFMEGMLDPDRFASEQLTVSLRDDVPDVAREVDQYFGLATH